MLKLKVKPTGNLGLQEIQCYSMTVSPDLSYISGRTSYYNALLDGETVKVVNNKNKFINVCTINTENVKVQGRVLLEVTLPIKTMTKEVLMPDTSDYKTTTKTVNYVEYKGVYSYGLGGSYLIDGKLYTENDDDTVTINTYEYIEDGYVTIAGKRYIANYKKGNEIPEIKEEKNLAPLVVNQYVAKGVKFVGVSEYERRNWKNDTKFIIYKHESDELGVEDILYGAYNHFITYEGENYYLSELYEEDSSDPAKVNYVGYGVKIGNKYYTDYSRAVYDGEGDTGYNNDEKFNSALLIIEGEYYEIQNSLVTTENDGKFLYVITGSEKLDLREGITILAKSNGPIRNVIYVEQDDNDSTKQYITYIDKRYDVKKDAYKFITVSGIDYRLITEEGETYAIVNGNKIYYTISGNKAFPNNKIYYNFGNSDLIRVEYGISENGYDITKCSGVTIGDTVYRVYDNETMVILPSEIESEEETFISYPYVEIYEDASYNLTVRSKIGSKTYICYPSADDEGIASDADIDAIRRHVSNMVVSNREMFTFYIRNDIFGESPINPGTYFYDAVISTRPTSSIEKLNLSIFKVNSYLNVKFPVVDRVVNDIMREDVVSNYYSAAIKDKKRAGIVDMEKDVYYPVWTSKGENDETIYNPILNVRFNLHFRTRFLETWKVIEDYVEDSNEFTNWFVTDYRYYKDALNWETTAENAPHTLHNASDLLGYMNFTTEEIRNRASKIGKSFLRLSFYSTDNPQTQTLLGTSTIFMDEAYLAKKVYSFQKSADAGMFIRTQAFEIYYDEQEDKSNFSSDTITADSEYERENQGGYDFSSTTTARLSSCMNVYDKGITNGSSEGFYFYMFREYANNLRPLRIYLRIDFNHAGIGRTIPFMLPRKEIGEDGVGKPLYIHNEDDLKILKNGFKLKDIYKQLFIPIDVIYDDKSKKYVYYLPEDLRENKELGVNDEVMEFNLFEVKFKDESAKENDESNQ